MTIAIEPASLPSRSAAFSVTTGALAFAGVASLGAGAIHAAAAGVHSEHRQAVITFVFVAAFQLGWGALSLVRSGRLIALAGIAGNTAAFAGWLMAKNGGIGFVDGLEASESAQFADTVAAVLAGAAAVLAVVALERLIRHGAPRALSPMGSYSLALSGALVAAISLPAMVSAGSHTHAGGHAHGAEAVTVAGGDGSAVAADGHTDDGHANDAGATPAAGATDTTVHTDHGPAAAVAPVAYDPTKPIDLGGVSGVTPEQQARAENLVAITLARLPKFADPAVAESLGWHSIGDGITGHEHYVNWSLLDDGRILDPDFPESLVYEVRNGQKTLVSAMFMLAPGATLDTAPDIGGALTQWHIHDNLCFAIGPNGAARVIGLTDGSGNCRVGQKSDNPVPMIHVWITAHPCGPFAALEGVGAGQVKPGETHLCDHAHGA